MADIQAFRGIRYDLGRVGELSDVVAPPYDVIDAPLQDALYQRSPHNAVRLVLNKEQPTDSDADNRYTRAAQTLRDWQSGGILAQDSARALYVYHQEFEVEGRRFTRKGFMARVRLEPFGEGRIYPHEETMAGPKADRLKLFHATQMNLSQIFGLFPDERGEVQARLDAAVGRALPLQATDHLGVVSKLWAVTDQGALSSVAGLMGPKPIFIADGHHRYETALRYLEEKKKSGEVKGPDAAANFVLMMLVSMQDPGLVILPTHRLVSGLREIRTEQVQTLLQKHFDLEMVGTGSAAARETWERIEMDGGQDAIGVGTTADGVWHLARFKDAPLMERLAPDHSPSWRSLGVAYLQKVVLEKLLAESGWGQPKVQYVHLLKEVDDVMAARGCQMAFLTPPAGMKHVEQIAGNLEKMPPKSTYFYPKLLSGLVFHSLKGA